MADDLPEPLRGDRMKLEPKLIKRAATFTDFTGVLDQEPFASDLDLVLDYLEKGFELPSRFYRPSMDRQDDQLLIRDGYKHLHLGKDKDDVLLFVIEFDGFVVLAEANGHRRFKTEPPGSALKGIHDAAVRAAAKVAGAEVAAAKIKATRAESRQEKLRAARERAKKK
ncbi:hypothetical protein QH494_12750 [Sphingomonas sp. AR_OL41]|uniref:hypothetical protein n=1 Tax=Sphingomonas sp. AR_OL41 TaxID=3042729 RepID=UPI002480441D|nr:hypothetical protein [Sphingomonas sp. AR_OL41]MDH7973049.1 hypothetical protein [Sphingomonas sp. AR_OL41]